MPSDWTDRTIRGPAAEYLTAEELGRLFGMSGDTVRRWTDEGILPPPIRFSSRSVMYSWRHAVYLSLRSELVQGQTDLPETVKEKKKAD